MTLLQQLTKVPDLWLEGQKSLKLDYFLKASHKYVYGAPKISQEIDAWIFLESPFLNQIK